MYFLCEWIFLCSRLHLTHSLFAYGRSRVLMWAKKVWCSWLSSVTCRPISRYYLKTNHDCFLTSPYRFISHSHPVIRCYGNNKIPGSTTRKVDTAITITPLNTYIHFASSQPISLRSSLIASSHLTLDLSSGHFPKGFPVKSSVLISCFPPYELRAPS